MTGLATLVTRDAVCRAITFRMLMATIGTPAKNRVLLPTGFVVSMLVAFVTQLVFNSMNSLRWGQNLAKLNC